MTNKVLITGGTGFIGRHLAHKLVSDGHQVAVVGRRAPGWPLTASEQSKLQFFQGELSQANLLSRAIYDVDVVFHKASSYSAPTIEKGKALFQSNVNGTSALIEALQAPEHRVKTVILDSSISVYGEGCYHCKECGTVRPRLRPPRLAEDVATFELNCPNCERQVTPADTAETEALNGSSQYAQSKKLQEQLLRDAAEKLGINLFIFRYATVFGPGQRAVNPYSRIIRALRRGEPVFINEDGKQKRDFVYVEDVVRANVLAMGSGLQGCHTMNMGSGSETALVDFVRAAKEHLGARYKIHTGEINITGAIMNGDVRHCKIDCTRIKDKLAFITEVPWQLGLARWLDIYDWLQSEHNHD